MSTKNGTGAMPGYYTGSGSGGTLLGDIWGWLSGKAKGAEVSIGNDGASFKYGGFTFYYNSDGSASVSPGDRAAAIASGVTPDMSAASFGNTTNLLIIGGLILVAVMVLK